MGTSRVYEELSGVWGGLKCMSNFRVYEQLPGIISPIEKRLVCGETARALTASTATAAAVAAAAAEHRLQSLLPVCLAAYLSDDASGLYLCVYAHVSALRVLSLTHIWLLLLLLVVVVVFSGLGAMSEPSVIAKEAFEVFCDFPISSTPPPHPPIEALPPIVNVDQQQLRAAAAAAAAAASAAAAARMDKREAKEEETGSLPVSRQRTEPLVLVREEGDERETTIPGSFEAWQLTARQLLEKPVWGLKEVMPACMSLMVLTGGDDPSLSESLRARLRAQGDSVVAEAFKALINSKK
ncbi:hypothetical protein Emed_006071 [Eimeria media]